MNVDELNIQETKLKDDLRSKLMDIRREFAINNSPYKIGDIIEDNYHVIRIESVKPAFSSFIESNAKPYVLYYGVELKKDLTPKKNQRNPEMYQRNVKRKLN